MEIKDMVKIEWSDEPVLTTNQLAERFGCEPKNIANNFKRSKEYFVEGEHYFKLTSEALRQFKSYSSKKGMAIHPYAAWVYLWTHKGCVTCAEFAIVYVLLLSNLIVKIGYTTNPTERFKKIRAETKLDIIDFHSSRLMSLDEARAKEAALKEKYATDCLGGEYFNVRFVDICQEI